MIQKRWYWLEDHHINFSESPQRKAQRLCSDRFGTEHKTNSSQTMTPSGISPSSQHAPGLLSPPPALYLQCSARSGLGFLLLGKLCFPRLAVSNKNEILFSASISMQCLRLKGYVNKLPGVEGCM